MGGLPAETLLALQFRDIGPEDYSALLGLGEQQQLKVYSSLGDYLSQGSLPRAPPGPETNCLNRVPIF